jgi:hypothetical protein
LIAPPLTVRLTGPFRDQPRSGKQHLFRDSLDTNRRHAFGLPVVGDLT